MHHVTGTDKTRLYVDASSRAVAKSIEHGTRVEYGGAPQGVLATHKRRLPKDLIDFLGQ